MSNVFASIIRVKMADNEFQVTLRTKLRTLWICLCFIGNSYQAYRLTKAYLDHDITTHVNVNFPEIFEPPTATVCFSLISMVKLDIALARWPDLEARMADMLKTFRRRNGTSFKEAIASLSFAAKLTMNQFVFANLQVKDAFDITYSHEDLFSNCSIVRGSDYSLADAPCTEFYDITEYLKSSSKCFTFKLKHRQFYNYLTLQQIRQFPGRTSILKMTNTTDSLTKDMAIYYNPRGTHSREGFSRSLLITQMALVTVSYVTVVTELLPPPFDTRCRNYATSGFFDRGHCFETCFREQSLEKLGKLAPGPNIFREDYSLERLIDIETVRNDTTIGNMVDLVNADCKQSCWQPNCKETYYIPQLMSTTEFPFPALLTVTEQEPVLNTTNLQKINLIESITDLGSTLGFWMGFTGLTVFDLFWTTYHSPGRRVLHLRLVQLLTLTRPPATVRPVATIRQ
ncbi:hypothetical protein HDE_07619 [Halotydeus destructor]|nr:hypothetical protein HDE_07619 [Halotydeus destructor]